MNRTLQLITLALAVTLLLLFSSCAGLSFSHQDKKERLELEQIKPPDYPETAFIVFSDPHFYDTVLGTGGPDFEKYLAQDRKMLIESREILQQAMRMMQDRDADFVLVAGDLTKDGEELCHTGLAEQLKVIEEAGYPVFVVPGNHDILNPHAVAFTPEGHEKVNTVNPEDFSTIYAEHGYNEALYRDSASLSYVAEPVDGLWLLALDSCDYWDNFKDDYPQTDGRFSQETVGWLEMVLQQSIKQRKSVIALMHHGVVEHFSSQEKHYGEYIIDDYENVSEMLALYNVRLVFTGHFHAQDIARFSTGEDKFLFDIETGSLVTYPSPVRYVQIGKDQRMVVRSHFIQSLPSLEREGIDFPSYSEEFVREGIISIAVGIMKDLGVRPEEAERISPRVADAVVAHYLGDETFPGGEMLPKKNIGLVGRMVISNRRDLVEGLWNDPPPADNNIAIDLTTGEWEEN